MHNDVFSKNGDDFVWITESLNTEDRSTVLPRGKSNQALTLTEFNESTGYQDSKCNHELSEYVGFTDSFTFCKKCDKRINNA